MPKSRHISLLLCYRSWCSSPDHVWIPAWLHRRGLSKPYIFHKINILIQSTHVLGKLRHFVLYLSRCKSLYKSNSSVDLDPFSTLLVWQPLSLNISKPAARPREPLLAFAEDVPFYLFIVSEHERTNCLDRDTMKKIHDFERVTEQSCGFWSKRFSSWSLSLVRKMVSIFSLCGACY